ncbi:hypothetical protein BB560_006008, partial [Smittium megazygosporum]
ELHADKSSHIHVYIKFKDKINTTNPEFFDILGQHGHYETLKNRSKLLKYITVITQNSYSFCNVGDFVTNMTELEPSTRVKTASERILESTDYKEAIMIARSDEGIRRDIIRNSYQVFRSIKNIVEVNIQEQKSEIPAPVRDFIIPPEIHYWDRFSTCLWLCGKSGTGKTSLPNFCSNML